MKTNKETKAKQKFQSYFRYFTHFVYDIALFEFQILDKENLETAILSKTADWTF